MTRVWVYQTMQNDPSLALEVGDRIHSSTSLKVAPHVKPFLMYRMTSDLPGLRGDDGKVTKTSNFMILAHDDPGDYMRIDRILGHVERLFNDVNDQPNGIIRATWFENSDDWRDEDMGTIMKYGRVEVKYRTVTHHP